MCEEKKIAKENEKSYLINLKNESIGRSIILSFLISNSARILNSWYENNEWQTIKIIKYLL